LLVLEGDNDLVVNEDIAPLTVDKNKTDCQGVITLSNEVLFGEPVVYRTQSILVLFAIGISLVLFSVPVRVARVLMYK